jgi:hypothetical protein
VDAPLTALAHNRADANADLGIDAVRGVRDEGGNRAQANRDPRQCTGVVCRSDDD